jgi:hypothetical protein
LHVGAIVGGIGKGALRWRSADGAGHRGGM